MLHLTLRQLQVFESAAANLNFSLAAKQLFLSQPAVSMQIKQLEESIGLALFEQMGKKTFLTEAGRELFQYSRNITQQLAEMEGKVTLGGENCKVLSWAMIPSTGESEILIDVPKGLTSGIYDLTVTNQVGSDTKEGAFTIP